MCSGSFYSSLYVITSCRCFHSSIAIYPFHKERNASQYRVSVEPDERTILEISHFVTHPFCMKNKVKKPYKNHFGLIVLSKPFLISQVVPPLTTTSDIEYTRSEIINLSSKFTMCEVYGHHLDSGEIRVGSTKMILMKSEDCLLRLCIPKIGCKGKKSKITHGEDFCLKVPGDIRLDARFLEGSLVKCGGHVLGLVISPGSPRYPKVPTIFASVTQYLRNFPSPNV
ncbi:hypothetical protein GE061_006939 [Apolygus lucorum]|uniref:Peptidase S1 domain-containing protein n=1 Tax=Apolygus lucorum TaxID=248454 RepID=A0A6A4JA13_APOLU|nr:hypothetical protein GE061_006939 [Apolygus lucorum]